MGSTTGGQQEKRNQRWPSATGYLGKHSGMAMIGLFIGIGLAVPFIVAGVLAALRGSGAEVSAWLLSALLLLLTMPSLALWASRRD